MEKLEFDKYGYALTKIEIEKDSIDELIISVLYENKNTCKIVRFSYQSASYRPFHTERKFAEVEKNVTSRNIIEGIAFIIESNYSFSYSLSELNKIPESLLLDDNAINELLTILSEKQGLFAQDLLNTVRGKIRDLRKDIKANINNRHSDREAEVLIHTEFGL